MCKHPLTERRQDVSTPSTQKPQTLAELQEESQKESFKEMVKPNLTPDVYEDEEVIKNVELTVTVAEESKSNQDKDEQVTHKSVRPAKNGWKSSKVLRYMFAPITHVERSVACFKDILPFPCFGCCHLPRVQMREIAYEDQQRRSSTSTTHQSQQSQSQQGGSQSQQSQSQQSSTQTQTE